MKSAVLKKRIPRKVREAYALVGSFGGRATFKKVGSKGMSRTGKKGSDARWGKKVDKPSTNKSARSRIK